MSLETDQSLPVIREDKTKAGNYFVSNYPPFSFWSPQETSHVRRVLDQPPVAGTPLGLYVHIPFCRKRCHFCYFKVYTDKNAREIAQYIDAVKKEMASYARMPFMGGRRPQVVYFGGGTPSYLSAAQLEELFGGLKERLGWDEAQEVTFECEPGTLNEKKLATLKELGVTRLSLGIENFDDHILEINNRAHLSKQVMAAYETARAVGFAQINIDLIAGMMEETEENWDRNIEKLLEIKPDSVTIYQMEIPYNTTIYQQMKLEGKLTAPVADWRTKRRWVMKAFAALEAEGYTVGSAYTAVKDKATAKFLYRDNLWHGADLVSVGVSSFGYLNGMHVQNEKDMAPYLERVEAGQSPIHRAFTLTEEEKLIREFILQLKLGRVGMGYFRDKYGVEVREKFGAGLKEHQEAGLLKLEGDEIVLSREALMEVDGMLPVFFKPEHRTNRYT